MASLLDAAYNPDVLSCLANLSNDEVFTPPELANQVLDLLPAELWENPNTKILDPFCKTGVFLREAAKRLVVGLEPVVPDLQERVDHIMHEQLYGIAITELTALLSRRSVYCSKYPNGIFSVSHFDNDEGNIRYRNIRHTWKDKRCIYCGASEKEYRRDASLESHAYELIHTTRPEEIFNMKFDVIVGNPPYQLSDGGAQKSAKPIYHLFIQNAKKLSPHYLAMIVPARWYSGGKGLASFREEMLADERISELHDFPDTSDCFPGDINIRGGVCYFLWDRNHRGGCRVVNHKGGEVVSESIRPLKLDGEDVFIRWNKAVEILRKVQEKNEPSFESLVSSRKPYGLATNYMGYSMKQTAQKDIELYRFGDNGFISKGDVLAGSELIDRVKIFEPYASPGSDDYPHLVLSEPIIAGPRTACTETYLVIGPFRDEAEARNVASYMKTQFFRFLLLLRRSAQHVTKKVYGYVPIQSFDRVWTDELLYEKYGITSEEEELINSLVKPMASEADSNA